MRNSLPQVAMCMAELELKDEETQPQGGNVSLTQEEQRIERRSSYRLEWVVVRMAPFTFLVSGSLRSRQRSVIASASLLYRCVYASVCKCLLAEVAWDRALSSFVRSLIGRGLLAGDDSAKSLLPRG